jgi:hypothetical protein
VLIFTLEINCFSSLLNPGVTDRRKGGYFLNGEDEKKKVMMVHVMFILVH